MAKRKRKQSKGRTAQKPTLQTLVDIVIPVYNRFDILKDCLLAIPQAAEDITYNIIIVDNASTEEPENFYDTINLPIDIVRNPENLGFPKACNIGAGRKRSPLIFFLNSDVILDPGSLKLLVMEMDDPSVGIVGMKLVFPMDSKGLNPNIRPPGRIQHIGLSINIHTKPIHHLVGWTEDNPKVMNQRNVPAVTGAAMLIRRSLWSKIGGFDEDFGHGTFEDVAFCMAASKLGYNIHVVPEARAIHYTGATVEKYRIGYPLQMNHLIFLNKWIKDLKWTEWEHW